MLLDPILKTYKEQLKEKSKAEGTWKKDKKKLEDPRFILGCYYGELAPILEELQTL
jgi:hypothetical protein